MDEQKRVLIECNRLLAACFCEPEKVLFIEENLCPNLATLLTSIDSESSKFAEAMQQELLETSEVDLKVDHAALFIGPFQLNAPPYGSVYLEKEGQVMGVSTLRVAQFYEETGIQVSEKEPADHIAIELEFMSYLFRCEVDAIHQEKKEDQQKFQDLQRVFFKDFLNPWIPIFCQKIEKHANSQFYRNLAFILNRVAKKTEGIVSLS
ncbi:MAG: molecular chaperone TorD family protein [SAR324 cluster bacterium]|nr:molecular chaperone TorD family protein [SAR324 cluster bacterium]